MLHAQNTPTDVLQEAYTPPARQGTILFYIQDIQRQTGISISYSSTFLHLNKKVTLSGSESSTGQVLNAILQGTGIQAAAVNGKIFLLRESSQTQFYTISGFVKEENSNEVVIGASIYDPLTRKGTVSNSYGFYSLQVPDSCASIVFSHIGYETVIQRLPPPDDGQLDIHMTAHNLLQTVVVNGEQDSLTLQSGYINMPVGYVSNFPALLGEKDVLKSLQLYPGTGSSLESSSNLLIRGGGADQNLYLLDGVPLYHTGHLFGLFSVFNGDAIKDVSLYKDAFPARYGGRLSSVVDIRTKDGNMKEWHGKTSISPASASLELEGPFVKDKSAMFLSLRRSLADLYGQWFRTHYGKFFLYDVNFKLNQIINNKNRIYISFYKGQDKMFIPDSNVVLSLFDDYSFAWSNITAAVKWTKVISPKVFTNTSLTYSRFYNQFSQRSAIPLPSNEKVYISGKGVSRVRDVALRNETEYAISNTQHLSFGGSYTYHNFAPTAYRSSVHGGGEAAQREAPKYYMSEFVLYGEDELSLLNNKLILRPGLHLGALAQKGSFYSSLQPRFMIRWNLPHTQYVQASFAQMTQFVHQLTTPVINLPTDLWVPSTENIRPEDAFSYSLSYQKLWENKWRFNANFYHKNLRGLLTTNTVLNIFDNSDLWEKKVITGSGYNYGSELLLEKNQGRFTGIFSYTLAWAWRKFNRLNGGKMYPYKEDRRHTLSIAGKYRIKPGWSVSASWKFSSGAPFTLPAQIFPDYDWGRNINGKLDERYSPFTTGLINYLPYIAKLNNFRLRPVHHLDVGTTITLGKNRYFRHVITAGVYNVYARGNPFIVSYDQFSINTYDQIYPLQLYQYSLFRTLPYLSYTLKF